MEIKRIIPNEPLPESSEDDLSKAFDAPPAAERASENLDVVEDASATKPISPTLANILDEQSTQATPNDASWIKSMSEPDADGSVHINLNIVEPPKKKPGEWRDTDHDGLTDAQEEELGLDPLHDADFDGDGVPDAVEVEMGMNPKDPDTDHDGIPDGVEYKRSQLAALIPAADPSKASDTDWDGDGFSNETEVMYGMNPSIPESTIPGNEQRMERNYNIRKTGDPLHDAVLASDLQRKQTAEEEGKVLDAVFDGMTSNNLLLRYHTAAALKVLDGAPIDPKLEAEMEKYNNDLKNALVNRDLKSWMAVQNALGLPVNAETIKSFENPTVSQLLGDVRTAMLDLGVQNPTDGTALGAKFTSLGVTDDGTPLSSASTGSTDAKEPTNANPAQSFIDRDFTFGSDEPAAGVDPTSDSAASVPAQDGSRDAGAGSNEIDGLLANLQAPSTDVSDVPTSRGGTDSVSPPESPSMSSFIQSGSGTSERTPIVTAGDDEMTVSNIVDVQTTTRPDGTVDHTTVTYTDGSKDILDASDNVIFHIEPPPPQADAGSDGTNPAAGTTDDDGSDSGDDDVSPVIDDGNSGEGTAYVNPDADVTAIPMAPSAVVGQIITTGVDPTTTTPSNPYVDDAAAPIKTSSGAIHMGLDVPLKPGVTDGNPDYEGITGSGAAVGSNPEGPDTVNPNDPELGAGGEDINPGDFSPRPSNA